MGAKGAGKIDRAEKGLKSAVGKSFAFGIADYLKAYAIDCLLTCFLFCFVGIYNGLGYTSFVMLEGVLGALAVRIPVSFLMSKIEPVSLFRIGLAIPCSTVLQIILCFIFLKNINKVSRKKITLDL